MSAVLPAGLLSAAVSAGPHCCLCHSSPLAVPGPLCPSQPDLCVHTPHYGYYVSTASNSNGDVEKLIR